MPSHGSLSKAGKCRKYYPKQFRITGVELDRKLHLHNKKHDSPSVSNRKAYKKFLLGKKKRRRQW